MAKVIVRDLKKRYDGVEAARGVSFEIQDGEIFGLIGPNGAGKTTTLECVIGLREPDAGSIEVCGIDARRHPREVKQKIGAALQTTSLQDKITPREALTLFGSFYSQRLPAGAAARSLRSRRQGRRATSTRSRAASASASRSRSPSSTGPSWSSSTSRPRPSTRSRAAISTARSCG